MAKEARELEQAFIAALPEVTGTDLKDWLRTLETAGMQKNNEIV